MKDYTTIATVIDMSGSMMRTRVATVDGYNEFIQAQKALPGKADVTLVLFDHEYQVIHDMVDIQTIPLLTSETYLPRGSTALLDSIGRTINTLGERLSEMAEQDRPDKVIVTIITDGAENCSKEFNRQMVRQMIETQQKMYKWEFLYFGANQDAFSVGGGMGIRAANNSNYVATSVGTRSAYSEMSCNVSSMRTQLPELQPAPVPDPTGTQYIVPNAIKGKKAK